MKTYYISMKYLSDTFVIKKGRYGNGTLAVVAESINGEGDEHLSINLEEYRLVPVEPNQFFVKDYSEHEGLPHALVRAGVARMVTGSPVRFGYGSAFLMELTAEAEEL